MKGKQLFPKQASSTAGGLLKGWIISIVLTLISVSVLTALLLSGSIKWEQSGYGVMGILLTAPFVGALVACEMIKRRRLLVSALSGTIYAATLLAVTALCFDGYYGTVEALMLIAAGSAAAALGQCAEKKASNKVRRKHRL